MALLSLPEYGLSTVFVVSFISATLVPLGSEPVVFGLVKLNPQLFWPAILTATVGNTLGGALDWWMGYGAHKVVDKYKPDSHHGRAVRWLEKLGPKACLLSWLPVVGDPLCAVAGWLKVFFLALRLLYGDWQVLALLHDDWQPDLGISRCCFI